LRFPQFNDKWKQTTLGEIGTYIRGLTYNSDDVQGSGYIVVRANNITEGKAINFDNELVQVRVTPSTQQMLMVNDIAICMANGSSHLVGKASYYNGNASGVCTVGAFCGIFRSTNPLTRWFFQTSIYNRYIYQSIQGGDGAIANLKGEDILKQIYSLPSLAEQKKIAGFLSLIDERIESCSETIKEIKAQKSCLRTLILNTIIVRWIKLKQAVEQGIINLKRGEVIPKQSQSSENIYPVYSSSVQNKGLMGFHNSYMFDKELISWSIDGGGHLFYRPRHKFNVTNVCGVLETSCFDYVFLCEVLKEQHRKLLFDYQNKAHPSVIQELYQVPMLEISEQRYYGKLFRLLDERIEVEEELLEQYEKQKRYLLRQMFV